MATVKNLKDLIAGLGSVSVTDDLMEMLERSGITLSDELKQKLASASPAQRLSEQARSQLLKKLQSLDLKNLPKSANFKIQSARVPSVIRDLPEGDYDVTIGIKLDVVNQVLAGAHEIGTWPKELDAPIPLESLRNISDDIPDLEGLEVGKLHLAPPTTTVISQNKLVARQPFELDLDQVLAGSPRLTVSTMKGTLFARISIQVVRSSKSKEELKLNVNAYSADPANRIEIDPDSDIQPRNEEVLGLVHAFVSPTIKEIIEDSDRNLSISPIIHLPKLSGISIQLGRVDIIYMQTPDNVGALMIGLLLGTDLSPVPRNGDPSDSLRRGVFQGAASNVYLRVHEALINKLAREAVRSGLVEDLVREIVDFLPPELSGLVLKVDQLSIDFKRRNKIQVFLDAKLEDFCGLGPIKFLDLDFTAKQTIEVSPPVNGRLKFILADEWDINFSDSDAVACLVSDTGSFLTLLVSNMLLLPKLAALFYFGLVYGGGEEILRVSGIFDVKETVPGTDLLPKVEVVQAVVNDEAIEVLGALTLRLDNIHTIVYARVERIFQRMGPLLRTRPIPRASVEVFDQDAPSPSHDDIPIPKEGTRVEFENKKIKKEVTVHYEPHRDNVVLAEGRTDKNGRVRLLFDPTTRGGKAIIIRTTEFKLDKNAPLQVETVEHPIFENQPDLFFRITVPTGQVFDTRQHSEGVTMVLNARPGRLGQPDAPITLLVDISPGGGESEK